MNLPESLIQMGSKRNIMREIREYGLLRAREVGAEKVLDFSLGNPSVEPPRRVNDFIRELAQRPGGRLRPWLYHRPGRAGRPGKAGGLPHPPLRRAL